jgi:hypothetical protein
MEYMQQVQLPVRKPTPKNMRKNKRNAKETMDIIHIIDPSIYPQSFGSRVDKLPPYDKYNPKRVHVARRRRATKEHNAFPRGWKIDYEDPGKLHISSVGVALIQAGGWTTCTKLSENDWIIEGDVYA